VWVAFNRSIKFGQHPNFVRAWTAGECPVAENAIFAGQDKGFFQKKQSVQRRLPH
jgi:hypothetical protein